MSQYVDIIILLLVILFLFHKLYSILGTRPTETEKKIAEEKAAKIIDIIVKKADTTPSPSHSEENTEILPESASETDKVLTKIPNFNRNKFLDSAKKAFEMIVSSFSQGDTETLEMLVSKDLAKKFKQVIEQRQAEGITAETDIIGFDEAEITHAQISPDDTITITVKFISEQVNILKNKEGEVIEGDEQYIQNITDIWTFEKALTSTSPNWLLTSTKKS